MDSRVVFLTVVLAASAAGAGIRVDVTSDPKLPAPNLIDGKNPDGSVGPKFFEAGIKGKENCYSTFKPNTFKPGVRYVASCRIKPDKDVLSFKSNASGLGFSMSFVQPGWKLVTLHARGGYPMPDEWNTVYSEPATMPEGTTDWFREIGLRYNNKGTGWVDDLRVTVADAALKVKVAGDRPIRQVKVVNAAGEKAFDSGVLTGTAKTFETSVVANAAGTYTAMAVDDEGDVAAVTYPKPPKADPEKEALNDLEKALDEKTADGDDLEGLEVNVDDFRGASRSATGSGATHRLVDVRSPVAERLAPLS